MVGRADMHHSTALNSECPSRHQGAHVKACYRSEDLQVPSVPHMPTKCIKERPLCAVPVGKGVEFDTWSLSGL